MICSVRLKNFKSFADISVPLQSLTVIMGGNGAGKSSFIQALLAVRQSLQADSKHHLFLNGPLVNLGLGRDVLRQGANEELIEFTISSDSGRSGKFVASYSPDADALPLTTPSFVLDELTTDRFSYLTAERVGPRLVSPRSLQSASRREIGIQGDGALAVLERFRAEILAADDPRRIGKSGSLEELFQTYLAYICPTARIDLHPYGAVDSIGSSFTFTPPGGLPSLPIRPTNVGFGLSYALPVIVAALVAQPGGMLIVENPEAHLHTSSQRAMTDLLVRTAKAGVQVIVETHSRETFHWLRNKAIGGVIDGTDIGINYFQAAYVGGERVSTCSTLAPVNGSLVDWPQAFFDDFGSPTDLVAPVA